MLFGRHFWALGLVAASFGSCVVQRVYAQGAAADTVAVRVDTGDRVGPYAPVWSFFGADEPNYSYAPNGQALLRELSQLSAAPVYVRLHNLLTTGDGDSSLKWGSTNAYREDAEGRPIYDWTITDRIFDSLKKNGVRPLVEVGFMPEAMSTHPEPYRHTFPEGQVFTGWSYPPKDYAKWSALVTAWTKHLHERYGDAAVDTWLWEVWNEPDIDYWHGTPEEYDKLYDVTAAAIQSVLPHAKIGGPEATGVTPGKSEVMLRQFLEHCARGKNAATGGVGAPLAFISFHPKGSPKTVDGHVRMDIGHQLRAMDMGMRVVASFPEWKNTPIILGESDPEGCAACKGAQNGYRNGPLYGVSVAEATAGAEELARRNGVSLQGAVTWAFEFEDQPLFAGFRELATGGRVGDANYLVDKPVLNVFRMLGMLGGEYVRATSTGALPMEQMLKDSVRGAADVRAVATRGEHQVDVLVWNYHDDDVAAEAARVNLSVAGLPARGVKVQRFLMDAEHSNAYAVWQKMGSPAQPTVQQFVELQRAGGLEAVAPSAAAAVKDGVAAVDIRLERQGVTLVRFSW
ncbi:beta-xylosidase [Granulicella sp. L60]|jgi:xylan 1,4-beta-xylosidase|uniref:GH39 family glycosyl hydrolase n=1 Tax=Granulicella sp. L60 TaxID=1641866 RepID=UPI00131B87D4|nr:beta-xylosidase [Granulicella sp. L60]